ncbi:MAG: thiolase family protein [Acidimicrobiales bacterium]
MLDNIAVVGIHETTVGKLPGRSAIELQAEAGVAAVADAGLARQDVDAIFSFSGYSQSMLMQGARVAEYIGLRPSVTMQIDVGGPGTHHSALMAASAAIEAGLCTTALCTFGENGISIRRGGRGRAPGTLTGGEDFEKPYGLIAVISQYALLAERYMHLYGVTSEDLGAVAVSQRYHASLNPNAQKRTPITLAEHQASPYVSTPLRMLDCSLISDGAGAFVVTSKDRACDLPRQAVEVLGWGTATTHHIVSAAPDIPDLGAVPAAQDAYRRAGLTVEDVDVVYVHDACTVSTLIGIEALGLCAIGQGGSYASEGRLELGNPRPVNLHGGMLSHGHAGGIFHFLDALRQLRGEAGPRQVAAAEVAAVSGNGNVFSTYSTMLLGRSR